MIWCLPSRTFLALAIAALGLTAACVPLISAAPVPVSAHKKHHATSSHTEAGKQPSRSTTNGKSARSRTRSNIRAYSGPRLDSARRAALIERIGDELKTPASQTINYASALNDFYAQLEAHQSESTHATPQEAGELEAGTDATVQSGTVRVLQFGDSHTAADMFTGEARRVFQEQFGNG